MEQSFENSALMHHVEDLFGPEDTLKIMDFAPGYECDGVGAFDFESNLNSEFDKDSLIQPHLEEIKFPTNEEVLKEYYVSENESQHKLVTKDEPAVVLQDSHESTDGWTQSYDSNPPEKPQKTHSFLNKKHEDLASNIIKNYLSFKERQALIDSGEYRKSGPGRNRKNGHKTSEELRLLVEDYIRLSLIKITNNRRCKDRKDALITITIRALKKLTYKLIEKTAAKNQYKRNEVSKYLSAFGESHASFLFSIDNSECSDIVRSFVEFIVIYFPTDKAHSIISTLNEQDSLDTGFLQKQLLNLETREKTSKTSIKSWADSSSVLRQILRIALKILTEPVFLKNKSADHLRSCFRHFLGYE